MAYIRDRREERTGYQSGSRMEDCLDLQCDFIMCYRIDDTTVERIKETAARGYVVHLMTGIAWGGYRDYLDGKYDGVDHNDEGQIDRNGNEINHGKGTPYMVPTVSFADYISEKLRIAVDAGVEAIHVEEPEFWDRGGYSPAFKREYELYYREPWKPAYESEDAHYKCARLKAYLYSRTIDRVASSLKEYAKTKYNRNLRFYVPTHSLLNYTQWKIVSPEGKLADIPAVDGCIAQVWTGTSREKNFYDGVFAERTFETAFLEYGVMQELVKGTGRKMWFLHDPIEDNPIFDWNDYRKNYFCTVAASLLHPKINSYEICPWPNRVFKDSYPKDSPDAQPIPADYATVLNNTFNTLGNMEESSDITMNTGVIMADSQLYQREYSDSQFKEKAKVEVGTVLREDENLIKRFETELRENPDRELMLKFMSSNAFPAFYGLALPLLKYGVPVRPVLLENIRRYPGYLDDYDTLIMSYEFLKPESPDMNTALAQWVRKGGTLIYFGNGFDPFHKINSWWTGKYGTPAEHLFEMLEIETEEDCCIAKCGKGTVGIYKINPAEFCLSKAKSDGMRNFYEKVLDAAGKKAEYKNHLSIKRGNYVISAVLEQSVSEEAQILSGNFADMKTPRFDLCESVTVNPGENAILFDLDTLKDEKLAVIGTSVRINSMEQTESGIALDVYGAGGINANIRLKVPYKVSSAEIDGEECGLDYDKKTSTVLISFPSVAKPRKIIIK